MYTPRFFPNFRKISHPNKNFGKSTHDIYITICFFFFVFRDFPWIYFQKTNLHSKELHPNPRIYKNIPVATFFELILNCFEKINCGTCVSLFYHSAGCIYVKLTYAASFAVVGNCSTLLHCI